MSTIEPMKPLSTIVKNSTVIASSPMAQEQPQRPVPISSRAKSNVETKAAARKGLLNIMMNKFSSTPLQEDEYTDVDAMKLRQQIYDTTDKNINLDLLQYDASLTKSEREYLRFIILSGDTNSIQSASAMLQNEDVFPVQQQLVITNSSNSSEANSTTRSISCGDLSVIANDDDDTATTTTTIEDYYNDEKKDDDDHDHQGTRNEPTKNTRSNAEPGDGVTTCEVPPQHRDSMIQQQLFRLHETNKDLPPNELIQRMSRQNSILTMDDSTGTGTGNSNTPSTTFRHYRSMSPPPITEGEELIVSARSLSFDIDNRKNRETTGIDNPPSMITDAVITKNDSTIQVTTSVETSVHVDAINSWNPFDDISSWLDGSQGVEVYASTQTTNDSSALPSGGSIQSVPEHSNVQVGISNVTNNISVNNFTGNTAQQPFRILGTSADDVSCHPHVLSPPLMESLLAFVPEYHIHHHYSNATTTNNNNDEHYSLRSQQQHAVPIPESETTEIYNTNSNNAADVKAVNSDDRNVPLDCQRFTCQADTTTTITSRASYKTVTKAPEVALTQQQQRQQQFATSNMLHSSLSNTFTSSSNFWLKYSLVRDGPGLWTFLRQVRASAICILAIETTDGHVLGAYTSQPWRLSKGWYGNKDTFLWKMRRSRLETAGKTILQQICQESEIQVYPYRTGNVAVQYCSKKCLMLGQGEVIPSPKKHNPDKPRPSNVGKHYGYALYLDKDLTSGTTSSSETFGNPCLLDSTQRGAKFTVANIEVWTLTPHTTVADAEQSELSNLFLDGGRDSAHRLNFMNILVGGPI